MSRASQPDFDRVADIYRWAEYLALGPFLQRARTYFIPRLAQCRCAYVLGDGDGRFLADLLATNTILRAAAIDTSARMLTLLRARCSFAADRLTTMQASALDTEPLPGTDLVVTHFFLDCLEQHQVDALAQSVATRCTQGTLWLVSDFQVPEGRVLHIAAKLYIRLLYVAFRALTGLQVQQLPDPRSALRQHGFQRLACHELLGGLIYTELWQLAATDKIKKPEVE